MYFFFNTHIFSSVQSLSHVWLFATPWTAPYQSSLSFTSSQTLLKLMSIESMSPWWTSHPLPSASPPAFNLSQSQGLFQWVSSSHQMAKVLGFSFSINLSNEYSGLTSFQVSSAAQLCLILCDPMNHSMPGLPIHHQLSQATQTNVHWVGDCHATISSSVVPFSSYLQSFPA